MKLVPSVDGHGSAVEEKVHVGLYTSVPGPSARSLVTVRGRRLMT